jgi:hypothetical protein
MLYLIEGARNTGKTYISSFFTLHNYKFPFTHWYGCLEYSNSSQNTHDFALGKEIMLMDLNNQGLLGDVLSDRGMVTVFVWAILSNRISEQEAMRQFNLVINGDLFKGVRIIWVKGQNPDTSDRTKDFWDIYDAQSRQEALLYNAFMSRLIEIGVDVQIVHNTFDQEVETRIKAIKNVWNIN